MSLELARQSIVTAVEAAKVGCPGGVPLIEYDNRTIVDTQTATVPFVNLEIHFLSGEQADLSNAPRHRYIGQIHIMAAAKIGEGVAAQLKILNHFTVQLQRKQFGSVRTKMSTMAPKMPYNGWLYYPAVIPFWYDVID